MVSLQSIQAQLKRLGFSSISWGKTEVDELPSIILPEEVIYECVNGIYEAGFCLLVATNFRVLLVDKKPMNYLTVLDLRFDMINEIEYSHRLIGAQITIITGLKTLRFRSYNKTRLRKLIDHVQYRMSEAKYHQSGQEIGLTEQPNFTDQQLQAYLMSQLRNQQGTSPQIEQIQRPYVAPNSLPNDSDTSLAKYLSSQGTADFNQSPTMTADDYWANAADPNGLLEEGIREVFGKRAQNPTIY